MGTWDVLTTHSSCSPIRTTSVSDIMLVPGVVDPAHEASVERGGCGVKKEGDDEGELLSSPSSSSE